MRSHIAAIPLLLSVLVTLKVSCGFVADSQSDLTIDLLTLLNGGNGRGGSDQNVLVSPSSIFYGLAMLYRGMDGQTKRDVGRALGLPSSDRQFADAMKVGNSQVTTLPGQEPIFGTTNRSVSSTNAQSRFAIVVLDGVLGPLRLALHT